ncbi:hypothetical protein PUNSTDRAFT_49815 [Punctularia strigosozonata HHB-11173 SS5]|uniref:uncharacterized protein n=1 Tax=Punctularia strigosozonata (strain HHB-11173) TaxID=741275 RepID=UPI0004417862|nr:uncharacterized protein PUNSTDRAFT_49815 [Punctularia strigosozonata HHB-11173 SS5]EIN12518.1 hypothetical protein PUNSTDRAFT_49815 [Punctularia strigosozonata HHB-11173 SS5]
MDPAKIPQEIWDHIIASVDEDTSLQSCSLTCRSWLRASQARIFLEPITEYPITERTHVECLYCLLADSLHLRKYIRVLSITAASLRRFADLHLPNVQVIKVDSSPVWGENSPPWRDVTKWAPLSAFPSLTDLQIHMDCYTPRRFVEWIISLPRTIRSLSLSDIYFNTTEGLDLATMPVSNAGLHLTRLQTDNTDSEAGLEVLLLTRHAAEETSFSRLKSCRWVLAFSRHGHRRSTRSCGKTTNCSHSKSASIRTLCPIELEPAHAHIQDTLDFSALCSLTEVNVEMWGVVPIPLHIHLQHLAVSLSTIDSSAFNSLMLRITIKETETPLTVFLRTLDDNLSDPRFERLRELHISCPKHRSLRPPLDVEGLIASHFAVLRQRGVVVMLSDQ